MKDIAWSISKADTAMQCLYKYKRVYVDKVKLFGKALTLGTKMHDIIAKEIETGNVDVKDLQKRIDQTSASVDVECGPEIYGMLPHVSGFVEKWKKIEEDYTVKPIIEQKYAFDKSHCKVGFMSKSVYFRGVVDLWAFSPTTKKLIVIDHKTNKSAMSEAKVKDSMQLNMYVWMLTKLHGLDWERAHVALNFMRHGKLVWAGLSMEEVNDKVEQYFAALKVMEGRIAECEASGHWEAQPNFLCNWCQFKQECPGHNSLESVCASASS